MKFQKFPLSFIGVASFVLAFVGSITTFGTISAQEASKSAAEQTSQANTDSAATNDAATNESSGETQPPSELTETLRITRLASTIAADKERLAELEEQSNTREEAFQQATENLEQATKELKQKQQELAKLGDEALAAGKLREEITALEKANQLAQEKSDLAAKMLRASNEQINTLREKLQKDQLALDRLKGVAETPAEPPADFSADGPAAATPEGPPASQGATSAAATSSEAAATTERDTPATGEKSSTVRQEATSAFKTKEQLEARAEAEKAAQEVAGAEQAIVEQVERKRILKEDIDLERELLDAARQLSETLRISLENDRETLQQKRTAGAPSTEIQSLQNKINQAETQRSQTQQEIEERSSRLADLQQQLSEIEQDEASLLQTAETKRREAEAAERTQAWLESPFHPQNINRWAVIRGPKLVFILLAMFVLRGLAKMVSRRLAKLIMRGAPGSRSERENRASTLAAAFRYAATATVMIGGSLLFLDTAGMNITTLLGGAAVLGLAVAFGAQSLLKDYFCGFIILLENQYSINDVVKISDHAGLVEQITLRMTALRDLEGNLHFIPNGNISAVTNMTHTWSRTVLDIGVAYKEDVDEVIELLKQIGDELRSDPDFGPVVLDNLEMLGIDQFADSAVVIKFLIKTKPLQQWAVKREMLRRIKKRFDEHGIEIPFPHRTVYHHAANGDPRDDQLSTAARS